MRVMTDAVACEMTDAVTDVMIDAVTGVKNAELTDEMTGDAPEVMTVEVTDVMIDEPVAAVMAVAVNGPHAALVAVPLPMARIKLGGAAAVVLVMMEAAAVAAAVEAAMLWGCAMEGVREIVAVWLSRAHLAALVTVLQTRLSHLLVAGC
jgi:hypothetical protein